MSTKLFLQAMNIHQGGGLSLLLPLLKAIPSDQPVIALLDQRISQKLVLPSNIKVKFIKPSLLHRLRAEWWLSRMVASTDCVLCFGNLPPLFPLKCKVMVFLQNRYLVESVSLTGFSLKTRLRLSIERLWLEICAHHASEFIVQTESMKRLLCQKRICDPSNVNIWPFALMNPSLLSVANAKINNTVVKKNFRFIYAATGEPHKNHRCLIEAWVLLAMEGLRPELCVTLDSKIYSNLCRQIDEHIRKYQLNVCNIGFLPHSDLLKEYQSYDALIYPSLIESYGLPLIEAQQQGLKIIAAELDYVRDVVNPEVSFDPNSAVSIARSIKRFMGIPHKDLSALSASDFLHLILTAK